MTLTDPICELLYSDNSRSQYSDIISKTRLIKVMFSIVEATFKKYWGERRIDYIQKSVHLLYFHSGSHICDIICSKLNWFKLKQMNFMVLWLLSHCGYLYFILMLDFLVEIVEYHRVSGYFYPYGRNIGRKVFLPGR